MLMGIYRAIGQICVECQKVLSAFLFWVKPFDLRKESIFMVDLSIILLFEGSFHHNGPQFLINH